MHLTHVYWQEKYLRNIKFKKTQCNSIFVKKKEKKIHVHICKENGTAGMKEFQGIIMDSVIP